MAKIIAIANQKGGVGKTTTTINLGVGLTMQGKKVLLVDGDPQGSLTIGLGYNSENCEITLLEQLTKVVQDEEVDVTQGILVTEEGVHLVPANIRLDAMEMLLINVMCRETVMKRYMEQLTPFYDYIIIDCRPSLNMLTLNALACADSVLIPVEANRLSTAGLQQLLKSIHKIKQQINKDLRIEGIVVTKYDSRTNLMRSIFQQIVQVYGNKINILGSVPASIKAQESTGMGMSIYKYDKNNPVSHAYSSIVLEVLKNEE